MSNFLQCIDLATQLELKRCLHCLYFTDYSKPVCDQCFKAIENYEIGDFGYLRVQRILNDDEATGQKRTIAALSGEMLRESSAQADFWRKLFEKHLDALAPLIEEGRIIDQYSFVKTQTEATIRAVLRLFPMSADELEKASRNVFIKCNNKLETLRAISSSSYREAHRNCANWSLQFEDSIYLSGVLEHLKKMELLAGKVEYPNWIAPFENDGIVNLILALFHWRFQVPDSPIEPTFRTLIDKKRLSAALMQWDEKRLHVLPWKALGFYYCGEEPTEDLLAHYKAGMEKGEQDYVLSCATVRGQWQDELFKPEYLQDLKYAVLAYYIRSQDLLGQMFEHPDEQYALTALRSFPFQERPELLKSVLADFEKLKRSESFIEQLCNCWRKFEHSEVLRELAAFALRSRRSKLFISVLQSRHYKPAEEIQMADLIANEGVLEQVFSHLDRFSFDQFELFSQLLSQNTLTLETAKSVLHQIRTRLQKDLRYLPLMLGLAVRSPLFHDEDLISLMGSTLRATGSERFYLGQKPIEACFGNLKQFLDEFNTILDNPKIIGNTQFSDWLSDILNHKRNESDFFSTGSPETERLRDRLWSIALDQDCRRFLRTSAIQCLERFKDVDSWIVQQEEPLRRIFERETDGDLHNYFNGLVRRLPKPKKEDAGPSAEELMAARKQELKEQARAQNEAQRNLEIQAKVLEAQREAMEKAVRLQTKMAQISSWYQLEVMKIQGSTEPPEKKAVLMAALVEEYQRKLSQEEP